MANTTCEIQTNDAVSEAGVAKVDMKLENVVIPVSDVDRSGETGSSLYITQSFEPENGR